MVSGIIELERGCRIVDVAVPLLFYFGKYLRQVYDVRVSCSQGHWIGFLGSAVSNYLDGVGKELRKTPSLFA